MLSHLVEEEFITQTPGERDRRQRLLTLTQKGVELERRLTADQRERIADAFRKAGVSLAIWANHNLRASITAMRETTARILREESLAGVEPDITTVSEIFDIQGNAELKQAEARYLPATKTPA